MTSALMTAATLDVRTAALDAVRRGWPVVPATYPDAIATNSARDNSTAKAVASVHRNRLGSPC